MSCIAHASGAVRARRPVALAALASLAACGGDLYGEGPLQARVRTVSGTGAMGAGVRDVSAGGQRDLVVVDNFLSGEPTAITP